MVEKTARADAKKHFSLNTQQDILDFIAARGLESLQHDNTDPLKFGHPKNIGKMVDAYEFKISDKISRKSGYIAFHLNFLDKWVIKSFHPPTIGENSAPLTYSAFSQLERKNK